MSARRGMKNFVRQRNVEHGNANPTFDDLKVPTSRPTDPSSARQIQSKTYEQNQRDHSSARHVPSQPQHETVGQRPFYETDASSIDAASIMSAPPSQLHIQHTSPTLPAIDSRPSAPRPSGSANGSGGECDEGEDSEGSANDPLEAPVDGRLNARQRRLMAKMDSELGHRTDGIGLLHLPGDSYPSTTSGQPSDVDLAEQIHQSALQRQMAQGQAQARQYQSTNRVPLNGSNVQSQAPARPPLTVNQQGQSEPAPTLMTWPNNETAKSLERGFNSNFTFARADEKPISKRQSHHVRDDTISKAALSNAAMVPNGTAQRAPAHISADQMAHRTSQRVSQHTPAVQGVVEPTKHGLKANIQGGSRTPLLVQPVSEIAQDYEQLSHTEHDGRIDLTGTRERKQSVESSAQLDFEPEKLFEMNYSALKGQDFDKDPNAAGFHLPAGRENEPLDVKLSFVAEFQQADQARFFESLAMAEWEQAGDWFLDRFREVMVKLKDARQEKRRVARTFEDEVEKREKAVCRKRKQTEDELAEMRESGGKVLQGTPKRAK